MSEEQTPRQSDTTKGLERPSVARLLYLQRTEWQQGQRSPVEKYLEQSSLHKNDDVVLDLLYNEVILRQELGDAPAAEEYFQRFPHLASQVKLLFEVDQGIAGGQSVTQVDTVLTPDGRRQFAAGAKPEVSGFEVMDLIGRGGMGVVYRARQLALDRIVALKMIRSGLHADDEDLRRFRTEALAAARLQHPNIAQVYDVADHDGRPFLVMEYVAGGGLDRRLVAGPMSPRDSAKLIATLASAIHFAHQRDVIHRDLKPANVLLADSAYAPHNNAEQDANSILSTANPKVTDFGLAKLMDVDTGATQTGNIVGTPTYMAPEQAAGQTAKIGPATDIYALGTLLYECLTGHPPFQGQSAIDTLALIQHQDPVPPRQMRPKVPRDLETICLKCLEKDPSRRYSTAQALVEDLDRFQQGRPVRARPMRVWGRAVRWLRRHPAGAAVVVLSAILFSGLVFGAVNAIEHKAQTERVVETALREAEVLRDEQKWSESLASIRRANELLGQAAFVSSSLRQRAKSQQDDVSLADALERIQQRRGEVTPLQHELHPDRNTDDYERAFSEHGYKIGDPDVEAVGKRVRSRPATIREQIISALDDWIITLESDRDKERRDWLGRLVEIADANDEWRNRLRAAQKKGDLDSLKRLAAGEDAARQSPNAILLVAAILMPRDASNEAVELLRRAQRQMPGEYWINSRLASYCMRLQPPATDEALRYALVAQALRPKEPGPQFYLGYVLQKLGRTDEAIAAFRRAGELDEEYYVGLLFLGESLKKAQDWPKALTALQAARSVQPDVARVHHALAEVLAKLNQLDEAIAAEREAIRLEKTADHLNTLATLLVAKEQRSEAIELLREAIALNPNFGASLANLGYLLMLDNQLDEAIAILEKCVRVAPTQAVAYLNLGRALQKKGRHEEAITRFREVFRLQPTSAEPHVSMGQTLEALNDNDGAFAAYRDAIAADANNPNGHCYLGLLYMKVGKPAEALPHLKAGHELGSKSPKWTRPSADWVRQAEDAIKSKGE